MENNNRQGCRWVKAEDKLPEYLKKGFSKMSDYVPVRIYDDYEKRVIYSTARYCHDRKMWFDIMHNSENNCVINPIEWYDPESIEPCATSSENYWKQRCDVEMDEQKLIEIFKRVSLWDLSECKFEYEKEDTYNHWCNAELNGKVIDSITWDGNIFSMMNNNGTFSPLNPMLYYSPSPTGDRDCEELKKENDELRKEIEALKSNLYSKED